jgi:hexosaminidase
MQALGIDAASDPYTLYQQPLPASATRDYRREDRELELCSQAIVLALEDDAPLQGERESYLLDILNPCWIWKDAPLESLKSIVAAVGQVPFNFEIGEAIHDVVVEAPRREHGELRVRFGGCDGPVIAEAPLAPAVANPATTQLPAAVVTLPENTTATADLCFSFTRPGIAPIWAIDWIELVKEAP